ncbi:hypothetical protein Hhel01_02890 [Haloferula helveola]
MIYWGFAFLFPRVAVRWIAIAAGSFCLAIELSQLSSHPFLVDARSTRIGALILGHGFLWIDLLRYAAGIGLAAMLDFSVRARIKPEPATAV